MEALKQKYTINQLATQFSVHPNQIMNWKKQLTKALPGIFANCTVMDAKADEELQARLYQEIGQLKVELDWLKKKLPSSVEAKRTLVETAHPKIAVARQCALLGLNRATLYYQAAAESSLNLELMRLIDEQYTDYPFYGIRRGIRAIYPEPRTTIPNLEHRIYPYLLRGVSIQRVNQVWSCDITYIRLVGGFLYLIAVMDWHSRFVLSWELSNTMEVSFCIEALDAALLIASPEIFNTDQGAQFTARSFRENLESRSIRISMDGRGRAFDNIFIERLWRSVKYEDIYLKDYQDGWQAREGIGNYFLFYNEKRLHSSLSYRTPKEVYFAKEIAAQKK